MKTSSCVAIYIPLTVIAIAAQGQTASPLQSLPFQAWTKVRTVDGREIVAPGSPKERAVAGKWSLGMENPTTRITEAYRYRDLIVVFGWAGNYNGIATIIDALTGKEKLELLVNQTERVITNEGALLYTNWSVKGAYEPDDSIWLLDLNHFAPPPVSAFIGGVAIEAGRAVYPNTKQPFLRHNVGDLRLSSDSRMLFLIDWPVIRGETRDVCIARLDLGAANGITSKVNCVNSVAVTGYTPEQLQNVGLNFKTDGGLTFSVTSSQEPNIKEDFDVDQATLALSRSVSNVEAVEAPSVEPLPLRVPWEVAKQSLSSTSKVDLLEPVFAGHQQDVVTVHLVIGETGAVTEAKVSGSGDQVCRRLESVFKGWHFKPTILDGRVTKVRVQTESTIEHLTSQQNLR